LTQIIWLTPLLPFIGFIIALLLGKRFGNIGAKLSTVILGVCILLSFYCVYLVYTGGSFSVGMNWFVTAKFSINFGMLADGLSAMMLVVVSIVSFLVHLYSIGYMHGDSRYWLFFVYLQLFSASMFGLVLANNYLQMYIFWELVGLCSYLLIGFWYEKQSASDAAKKAFLTTRIGDVGMMIGILLLFLSTGTLTFGEVFTKVANGGISPGTLTAISILLFAGAVGKSAQFPLHVWLPDAMEGPTPVSALIHAATMVAAGVYLVGRSFPLFSASGQAMTVVATVGAFTAIFAATIAVVQTDIKKILAYSTISQLGYMIFALGMGAYTAGLFHLMTHAFFKALLFLGSGSIIHATGTQDITEMGGLAKKMKTTTWTFVAGALSLSGFPLLAGFWSKDEILGFAFGTGQYIFFVVGAFTAFLTAFYMFRLVFVVFGGKQSHAAEHAHESPKTMTIPLIILAILAIIAGYVGAPFISKAASFGEFIKNGIHVKEVAFNFIPMAISVVVALCGILLAYLMYGKRAIPTDWLYRYVKPYHKVLVNKYYMDEFYSKAIVRPGIKFAHLVNWFDKNVIDGFVNLAGKATLVISKGVHLFDLGVVDGFVNWTAKETYNSGKRLRQLQTGNISGYAIVMFAVLAVYIIYIIIRAVF
jgi:proton-translocating NADH-quinone oxidoreductase, chain L